VLPDATDAMKGKKKPTAAAKGGGQGGQRGEGAEETGRLMLRLLVLDAIYTHVHTHTPHTHYSAQPALASYTSSASGPAAASRAEVEVEVVHELLLDCGAAPPVPPERGGTEGSGVSEVGPEDLDANYVAQVCITIIDKIIHNFTAYLH
jgi:hypothetical protein